MPRWNTCGPSISAAIVMAAGSVMSEPASGTALRHSQALAVAGGTGSSRASPSTQRITAVRTGSDAAITITTNTKAGSV